LNWDRRTLAVQETHHGDQRWVPKDYECRVLNIKTSCMEYLKEERQRQEGQDLLGAYLLPSGSATLPHLRGRPLDQGSPQKALDKMLTAEKKRIPILHCIPCGIPTPPPCCGPSRKALGFLLSMCRNGWTMPI